MHVLKKIETINKTKVQINKKKNRYYVGLKCFSE